MGKLAENVGIRGLHGTANVYVNDLPAVHDELLGSVAYSEDLLDYYNRISKNAQSVFGNDVIQALMGGNGKFTDIQKAFPRSTVDTSLTEYNLTNGMLDARYSLMGLSDYSRLSAETILIYTKGSYDLNVTLEVNLSGMMSVVLFTNQYSKTVDDGVMEVLEIALPESVNRVLSPSTVTRMTVWVNGAGTLLSQMRIPVEPSVSVMDYRAGQLADYPFISVIGDVRFDVNEFMDKNFNRLSHAFANRVAGRLLTDKLLSPNLNLHTNSNREDTKYQIEQCDLQVKEHLKAVCTGLYFKAQSTELPPFVPRSGIEIGGYV